MLFQVFLYESHCLIIPRPYRTHFLLLVFLRLDNHLKPISLAAFVCHLKKQMVTWELRCGHSHTSKV